MNRSVLWILAALVLAAYLLFLHTYLRPFDLSDLFKAIDFISAVLTPLLISLVLSLLLSFIPWKQQSYKSRFSLRFPLSLILVCALFAFALSPRRPGYDSIKPEAGTDCLSVKDGLFETDGLRIERKANRQIETELETKERHELMVTWITDCEYQLTAPQGVVRVKIVSVSPEGYECYALVDGRTSRRMKVLRIKE